MGKIKAVADCVHCDKLDACDNNVEIGAQPFADVCIDARNAVALGKRAKGYEASYHSRLYGVYRV